MLQLYFLSVFCNCVAGLILSGKTFDETANASPRFTVLKFVLGIVTLLTALLILVSPLDDDLQLIGDIVPALAGFVAGARLIYEYLSAPPSAEEKPGGLHLLFSLVSRKTIGYASLLSGIIHFLIPKALFL